jgi:hypothetical protein
MGCVAAQQRLAPSDVRRKTEPDYRLGWNSSPEERGVANLPPTQSAGRPPAPAPEAANATGRIGPSFDCSTAHRRIEQLICSNSDLSRSDLRFVQAYYALRQQVGEAGWQLLKQEDLAFESRILQQCGVPEHEPLPSDTTAMVACVSRAYEAQRAVLLSRLTGAAAEEAKRPTELHVQLQRDLQKLGFLTGAMTIDGVYGGGTRNAIAAWQNARRRPATGFLSDADAQAMTEEAVASTGAQQPAAPPEAAIAQ